MVGFLVVLGIVISLITAVFGMMYFNKRRSNALRHLAQPIGYSFSERDDGSVMGKAGGFHLFSHGLSTVTSNVLTGSLNEISITIFDYQFITGGRYGRLRRQTVVALWTGKALVDSVDQ